MGIPGGGEGIMQLFRCDVCKIGELEGCLMIVNDKNCPPKLCPYSAMGNAEWKAEVKR